MSNSDLTRDLFFDATNRIEAHLERCCAELVEWEDTGQLVDGEVRIISRILSPAFGSNALSMTEGFINRAARIRIAKGD